MEDPVTGSVTVPSNALSYADGRPVTGPVTVKLSVIDVTDPTSLASMPGDFSAIGADGAEVMLESLGAAWINATDEKGEELEVGPRLARGPLGYPGIILGSCKAGQNVRGFSV